MNPFPAEPTTRPSPPEAPATASARPRDARRFAILTCMDARLDPTRLLGVPEGSAHVIRNAGGHPTDEVIQTLILSHQLLGTREWFLIQHTDCGVRLSNHELAATLGSRVPTIVSTATASFSDLRAAVAADLTRIRQHPQVPAGVLVFGYVYDVRLNEMLEVTPTA
ncbi:beta-class carbonic anhydrase [Hymenobacter psychrophilus]|uniref:Carbonic anhydrase n=1 Tax=Hymenobacter psychrophilus TaxID=651662 RepID=A0A1H3MUY5_9BACT|nr:carbonic anhydrase [Hymenobacter psychrophilus]SDY80304.1 carbonic anhydrase [Hymenobacter psychrophilus]